jgi:hypothetical protein
MAGPLILGAGSMPAGRRSAASPSGRDAGTPIAGQRQESQSIARQRLVVILL